jgi:hypothetical protein
MIIFLLGMLLGSAIALVGAWVGRRLERRENSFRAAIRAGEKWQQEARERLRNHGIDYH